MIRNCGIKIFFILICIVMKFDGGIVRQIGGISHIYLKKEQGDYIHIRKLDYFYSYISTKVPSPFLHSSLMKYMYMTNVVYFHVFVCYLKCRH